MRLKLASSIKNSMSAAKEDEKNRLMAKHRELEKSWCVRIGSLMHTIKQLSAKGC